MRFTDNEKYMDNKIKQIRKAKGLTQEELGRRTGKTQTYIARLEVGGTSLNKMTVENAKLIADALGVEISDLFAEGSTPTPVVRQYTAEEVYAILKRWEELRSEGTEGNA